MVYAMKFRVGFPTNDEVEEKCQDLLVFGKVVITVSVAYGSVLYKILN